jgi:hypothetical protein
MGDGRSNEERGEYRARGQGDEAEATERQASVQDLLSGLALNVLTALGRIDPDIYVEEENGTGLRLRPGLKARDQERWALLQKAFASVLDHPEASRALARGVAKARGVVDGGWPSTVYDVKVDALSTFDDGQPYYRFRVVGEETPKSLHWQKGFMAQYALEQRHACGIPTMMDVRSGLMFTTASIVCHNFKEAKKDLIESWLGDCCRFNGRHGEVVNAGSNQMTCKI